MKKLAFIIPILVSSISFAKVAKHEIQLNSTKGEISFSDGNTYNDLAAEYSFGFNENIQLTGLVRLLNSSSVIGLGAKYNFDPKIYMHSYYARAMVYLASGDTTFIVGGGKRFRVSKNVAYTPEAQIAFGDATVIVLYPIAFSFSANEINFN